MTKLLFVLAHAASAGTFFFLYQSFLILPEENEWWTFGIHVMIWVFTAFGISTLLLVVFFDFWRVLLSRKRTSSRRLEEKIKGCEKSFEFGAFNSIVWIFLCVIGTYIVSGTLFVGAKYLQQFIFAFLCLGLLSLCGKWLIKRRFPVR
jgi:Na+/melibiose symporter-like transporter